MKIFRLLFVLCIGISLPLISCNKDDNGGPIYGKIEYDGKTFEINMAECLDVFSFPTWNLTDFEYLVLGNVTKGGNRSLPYINCHFGLTIGDPHNDAEFIISKFSRISFAIDDTNYSSSKLPYHPDYPEGGDLWAIKSLGIDPATGKPYIEEMGNNIKAIIDGIVKWTAGKNSAKVEFNLTLEDGKTAKGHATIPYTVFEK